VPAKIFRPWKTRTGDLLDPFRRATALLAVAFLEQHILKRVFITL